MDSNNMIDFIKRCKKQYPNLKIKSFERRWYDCKKHLQEKKEDNELFFEPTTIIKEKIVPLVDGEEVKQPNTLKIFMIEDMKRLKKPITIQYLQKYGFTTEEINWAKYQKYLVS